MEEIWQNIEGFEGIYQASTLGRIRSVDHYVNHWIGGVRLVKGKILKPVTNIWGYDKVSLSVNNIKKNYQVHRLVWEAFNGKIPEGMQVNHINECKTDNRLENLNLMTAKENTNFGTRTERAAKARSNPVVGCDSEGNVVVTFPSINEAHRNGYSQSAVCRCCKGIKPQYKGLLWKYLS